MNGGKDAEKDKESMKSDEQEPSMRLHTKATIPPNNRVKGRERVCKSQMRTFRFMVHTS